jgi:hypothetical protein
MDNGRPRTLREMARASRASGDLLGDALALDMGAFLEKSR